MKVEIGVVSHVKKHIARFFWFEYVSMLLYKRFRCEYGVLLHYDAVFVYLYMLPLSVLMHVYEVEAAVACSLPRIICARFRCIWDILLQYYAVLLCACMCCHCLV